MDFPYGDTVTIVRGATPVGSVQCAYDPAERRLYGGYRCGLRQGDYVTLRGFTARIADEVQHWQFPFADWSGGDVAQLEPAMPWLPDTGALYRGKLLGGHFDTTTDTWVAGSAVPALWSGPMHVEAVDAQGNDVDVAEQQVTVQPFVVQVPLEVTDIRPDDSIVVATSRDGRLVNRTLTVERVEAGSDARVRQVRAIENQG